MTGWRFFVWCFVHRFLKDCPHTRKYQDMTLGFPCEKVSKKFMKGEAAMESTSGKGKFTQITLPVKEEADSGYKVEKTGFLRIMLVEDDPTNQFAVSRMLELAGHEVVIAGDGQEAVKILENDEKVIDFVLMDIQMPVMGGIEAAKVIRNTLKRRNIPIVALTAHTMVGDREKFLEAGMDDYLSKPVEFEDLEKVIEKHFG